MRGIGVSVKRVFLFFEKCSKISGNGTGSKSASPAYPDPGGYLMEIWIGTLAGFGLLFALWTVFGLLLSGGQGTVVCIGERPGAVMLARRLRLLRDLGLFRGRLILLIGDRDDPADANLAGVEIVSPSELMRQTEIGAEDIDTAGNGDSSGHRVGGGLSEL